MSGFTLIELLVVITIIGILASIVVVNLNSARGKGQDAAIKEQMAQLRAQAALYYDDKFGYTAGNGSSAISGTTCAGNTSGANIDNSNVFNTLDFQRSLIALRNNSGVSPTCYLAAGTTDAPSQSWALTVKLRAPKNVGTGMWCVDSGGNSIEVTTAPTIVAGNYLCQ